jgi:hypothetical protein
LTQIPSGPFSGPEGLEAYHGGDGLNVGGIVTLKVEVDFSPVTILSREAVEVVQ